MDLAGWVATHKCASLGGQGDVSGDETLSSVASSIEELSIRV